MRHAVRSRRFGRSRSERAALVRSLAQALFRHERIHTTLPKAKEAQRAAEKLVTQAKAGTLSSRRRVEAWLQDRDVTKTLFVEIAPRFGQRQGGYTRIVHAGIRHGDGAPMAILELVERKPEVSTETKAGKKKAKVSRGQAMTAAPVEREKPAKPSPKPPKAAPETPKTKPSSSKAAEEKPVTPPTDKKKPAGFITGLRKFFRKGPRDQSGE